MQALILAAGLGTRLEPHTKSVPKPLFPIAGRSLLTLAIDRLKAAGCTHIHINTHHLAAAIEKAVAAGNHGIPVTLSHEKRILGTGGAIRKACDLIGDEPLLVINADIVCDVDLKALYRVHREGRRPVTMLLHQKEPFNVVGVDRQNRVVGFTNRGYRPSSGHRLLAFTGIQVIDPLAIDNLPAGEYVDIVDFFDNHLVAKGKIQGVLAQDHYWSDIGTPETYRQTVLDHILPAALKSGGKATPDVSFSQSVIFKPLSGDGSDRRWYRLSRGSQHAILVDHGIHTGKKMGEAGAFMAIGEHLRQKGVPVPRILAGDPFSGLVIVEDLGDDHLQSVIKKSRHPDLDERNLYQRVIDALLHLGIKGVEGFDPHWAFQTPTYSPELILEKECRYFMEAFVRDYLGWDVDETAALTEEFQRLAEGIMETQIPGLIHRDMQSRNIMVKANQIYFIDFQGARRGPIQYDLASLLIDPYVALPIDRREALLDDYCRRSHSLGLHRGHRARLRPGYRYCAVARNLQILGAFGFLTRAKGKAWFEQYIPRAAVTLQENLATAGASPFPHLKQLAKRIQNAV